MKTMKIEKQLLFTDHVTHVLQLQVKDKLAYNKETEGTHAVGFLYIQGRYENELQQQQDFQETLELDVLAPTHKLSGDAFYLDIANYEGKVDDGGVTVSIMMQIHGLKGEDDKENEGKDIALEQTSVPVEEVGVKTSEEEKLEGQREHIDGEEFEDLFEDAGTTYVSYRMVVADEKDTYASLAQRYEVKEEELADANNHKAIIGKMLVILP